MIAILLLIPREAKTKEEEGRIHLEARAPLPVGSYATLGVKTASRAQRYRAIDDPYILSLIKRHTTDEETIGLMSEIIRRESSGNASVCNEQYGCGSGQGLVQLIPSTVGYCEEKLGKKIDPFNPEENIECGMFLLIVDGIRHWDDPNGKWGSGPY